METSTLIFILDDDYQFARLVQAKLAQNGYRDAVVFTDEKECLTNMKKNPKILIVDYHLKSMTGLQFIKKTKMAHQDMFSILVSGEFHDCLNKIQDERFIQYVDKYVIKGMDEMNELIDAVENISTE
jgi:ActR/RegA family two-component response regulator